MSSSRTTIRKRRRERGYVRRKKERAPVFFYQVQTWDGEFYVSFYSLWEALWMAQGIAIALKQTTRIVTSQGKPAGYQFDPTGRLSLNQWVGRL